MTAEDFKRNVFPLKDKIFRFAKRLMDHPQEAEDITQDVFMKLWARQRELDGVKNMEAFAMTVTKNVCLDKKRSKKVTTMELPQADGHAGIKSIIFDPALMNEKSVMEKIIHELPEQQRMILQLREIEGYEFSQIAEITAMNENTIRVNLSRARKTIKEELGKIHDYGLKVN